MIIETKFDVGQRVNIIEPGIPGRVTEISVGYGTLSYKVEFWSSAEVKTFWAKDYELELKKRSDEVGIKP
jgi:hypothetical protein